MPSDAVLESTDRNPDREPCVVAGVDGSADSLRAAAWAAGEAEARGGRLLLAHAVHLPEAEVAAYEPADLAERCRAEGREVLDAAASYVRALHPALGIRTELSDRSAAHALVELSTSADLVVTGTRGHGGFSGLLVGSVSRTLAAHARCPLVVVRGEQDREVVDEVVLGVGSKPSAAALRYAFEAARRYGATLTAVHAWWPRAFTAGIATPVAVFVDDLANARQLADAVVAEALAPLREEFRDVKVRISTPENNRVPALAESARRARLLVVGAHPRTALSIGAGYVADGLLAHSPAPVAVIPAHR